MADLPHSARPDPAPHPWRSLWTLNPEVIYLNHGSFGACPIEVLDKQSWLRSRLEAEPVRFVEDVYESLLDASRQALADFVGTQPDHLVFVPNATTGVNTVLRSLSLQPTDELLVTNLEYNASRNALNVAAERTGAQVVVAEIPFPLESSQQVIDAVLARVSDRTRLVLLDHVTSQTALILPLQPLIQTLNERGIETLIDGAHAPGMIPLNLDTLGATYYTGNCHKWMCSPKGAGFLYVRPDRQSSIRPLVISHGANSPRQDRSFFHLEFDWVGTTDPTPYLCIPKAIQFLRSLLPGGWSDLMTHNRQLVLSARAVLCEALGIAPPCPAEMIGSMATLPLPHGNAAALQKKLFHDFGLEVPVIPWKGCSDRLIRISAQIYNTPDDYDCLAAALVKLLTSEGSG
ncbi:aminotransferase class V-fold PLP-dependent enzyme [Oscillatoria sp. FACHB-1407]|nr:aminotransferase class V-fold PLP-dependent enzyme [Oscillatoria sp. FACHB-1407]MBD2463323.1 aminotransferase class V-fold PLP-dependent enzyme [Oscillatoria sp. FACHB-1407]